MGEARKDRQLRMDAVLLEIFLQALHTGYAIIAIRGVADKLVVELADTDEDGYLLYGFEVDIITEVILEITDLQFFVKSFQADLRLKEVRFGLAWTTKLKNLYLQYEELNSIRRSQE